MNIEQWPIDRPKPYEKNARKIPQSAIDKVALSIEKFGMRQPIVVDKAGVVVVGHVRLRACQKLGILTVPVHIATDLTPAQIRQYRLIEIEKLLATSEEEDEKANEAPALPENPVSRLGDLWLLGPHRLCCGDSTSEDATKRATGAALGLPAPFLMVTDPPYGVEYDPEWRLNAGLNKEWQTRAEGTVSNDDRSDWTPAWRLFPGDVAYVWHGGAHAATVAISLMEASLLIRSQIIWAKVSLVIGRGAYHWQHEPCWYAVRKGKTAHWHGDRKQSTLWQIENMHRTQGNVDDGKTIHSTQKPIECMRRPILNHTVRGEAVYDPFLGSGTTLIACEMRERVCYGLELDPKYVDVIVLRWQKLTGKQATLEGDGRTFEEVGRERGVLLETDVPPKKATAKAAKPARKKAKRTAKR